MLNSNKKYSVFMVSILCVFGTCIAAEGSITLDRSQDVKVFIYNYCKAQFDGSSDYAVTNSEWSKQAQRRFKNYSDMELGYFDIVNDPMYVVTNFWIGKIEKTDSTYKVTVGFDEIAHTLKWGSARELIFEHKTDSAVFHVGIGDGKLKVLDPPEPRVSLKAAVVEMDKNFSKLYRIDNGHTVYIFPPEWPQGSPGILYNKRSIQYLIQLKGLLQKEGIAH